MKPLRKTLDRIRPHFMEGGRLHSLRSVYDGFETFLYTPRTTAGATGAQIHDSLDSKRIMIIVVLALMPCLLMGIYNTAYQNWLAAGATTFPLWEMMAYGLAVVLPRIAVTYIVGLGIEFITAQWRGEEIQEGFLVTGIMIPLICPVETPLWMLALATAFAVIFAKEVFGGTGYNIFNVALVARAFLFFAYPAQMSGDKVFISTHSVLGLGHDVALNVDAISGATPLGQLAVSEPGQAITSITGQAIDTWQAFLGLIPGSLGETSTLAILIGAVILLATGIASWRIMISVVAGTLVTGAIAHAFVTPTYPVSALAPLDQFLYGGLAFATVFMATDPVTSSRTRGGKYIYGFLIGAVAVIIRTYNNGYPEGAMLAVLLMNALAPLIDYCVVQCNISRRQRRLTRAIEANEKGGIQ